MKYFPFFKKEPFLITLINFSSVLSRLSYFLLKINCVYVELYSFFQMNSQNSILIVNRVTVFMSTGLCYYRRNLSCHVTFDQVFHCHNWIGPLRLSDWRWRWWCWRTVILLVVHYADCQRLDPL